MFVSAKTINRMLERIEYLERDSEMLRNDHRNLKTEVIDNKLYIVTCEKCGCAVFANEAFKGQSKIGIKTGFYYGVPTTKEYIKEMHYCKKHRPKE